MCRVHARVVPPRVWGWYCGQHAAVVYRRRALPIRAAVAWRRYAIGSLAARRYNCSGRLVLLAVIVAADVVLAWRSVLRAALLAVLLAGSCAGGPAVIRRLGSGSFELGVDGGVVVVVAPLMFALFLLREQVGRR